MKKTDVMTDVIVIGAGAAGLLAAGRAAAQGAQVLLLEQNEKPGRKIGITGKGRCNVTNACDARTFQEHVVTNGRFLFSALHRLGPAEMMALLEEAGVPLKVERGNRVFPVSDRAFDVIDGLVRYAKRNGARLRTGVTVRRIQPAAGGWQVVTDQEVLTARAVIAATGGQSYASTGAHGDGYRWAGALGHTVQACRPALIPFTVKEKWAAEMMGLSLKNIAIRIEVGGKKVCEEFGEMLFTHFGVSGPVILSASSYLQRYLREQGRSFAEAAPVLHLDLKPALSPEELDERLVRELEAAPAKNYRNLLAALLPQKMIGVMVKLTGIPGDKKAADIRREERLHLREQLKNMTMTLSGTRPADEAVITMGGVAVNEVDPKTMESRLCPGLFWAGEVLDVDALTGGFNLQIAFSTGYAAGEGAAAYAEQIKQEEAMQ